MPKSLRSPLCLQNVSFLVKVEGAPIKTNWKSRIVPKNDGLKKFGYSVLGPLRKPNCETKNNHFEKSHNAENCKRGPLDFLKIQFVAKYQKFKGWPFGDNKIFSKSHRAKKMKGDPSVPSGFANARKNFWLKQGLEPATAGFPLNRIKSVLKMVHGGWALLSDKKEKKH